MVPLAAEGAPRSEPRPSRPVAFAVAAHEAPAPRPANAPTTQVASGRTTDSFVPVRADATVSTLSPELTATGRGDRAAGRGDAPAQSPPGPRRARHAGRGAWGRAGHDHLALDPARDLAGAQPDRGPADPGDPGPRGVRPAARPRLGAQPQVLVGRRHLPPAALLPGRRARALRAQRRAVLRPARPLPDLSDRRPEAVEPAQPDHAAVLLDRPVRRPDRAAALQHDHGPAVGGRVRPGLLPPRRPRPHRRLLPPPHRRRPASALGARTTDRVDGPRRRDRPAGRANDIHTLGPAPGGVRVSGVRSSRTRTLRALLQSAGVVSIPDGIDRIEFRARPGRLSGNRGRCSAPGCA